MESFPGTTTVIVGYLPLKEIEKGTRVNTVMNGWETDKLFQTLMYGLTMIQLYESDSMLIQLPTDLLLPFRLLPLTP